MSRIKGPTQRVFQRGISLVELTFSIAIATMLSAGFFVAMNGVTRVQLFERGLTFYSSEVREVMHQIARDLRAAGSNPLAKPFLFDSNPWSDVAVSLDPNHDHDITNDIQVSFDRYGGENPKTLLLWEPDGDADDARESVRYFYDEDQHRIRRQVRVDDGWYEEIILVNVCKFEFTFQDSAKEETTRSSEISWIVLDAVTSTAPHTCYDRGEITRAWQVIVKLRNR